MLAYIVMGIVSLALFILIVNKVVSYSVDESELVTTFHPVLGVSCPITGLIEGKKYILSRIVDSKVIEQVVYLGVIRVIVDKKGTDELPWKTGEFFFIVDNKSDEIVLNARKHTDNNNYPDRFENGHWWVNEIVY